MSELEQLGALRISELRALAKQTRTNTVMLPNGGSLMIPGGKFQQSWVILSGPELLILLDELARARETKA